MNNELTKFARTFIREGLKKLPNSHQVKFRQMYGHTYTNKSIDEIVEIMDDSKLDWAMVQIKNSYKTLTIPECVPIDSTEGYCIEEHGDHYVLYFGRGDHSHGLNLCTLSDFDYRGEETRRRIVESLNK